MHLLPSQFAMYALAGMERPYCEREPLPDPEQLQDARHRLMQVTGCDFGYDLMKWHEYLMANDEGYAYGNKHKSILASIREAEADPAWREAIAALANASSPPKKS